MPTCLKCSMFVNQLHFGWCHNCLEQVGLDDQGVPQTPSRPTNIFNAIPLPSQPTQPVASTSLLLRMAEPADCAGTHAYFRDVGKSKRTKTPTPSPYARTARPAPPPPPIDDQIKLVDCGIVLYQLDKLKRTDIMCRMLQVNVLQPNLYLSLQRQLWELFSPSLLSKNLVESLPQDFLPHTNLSHKKIQPSRRQFRSTLPTKKTLTSPKTTTQTMLNPTSAAQMPLIPARHRFQQAIPLDLKHLHLALLKALLWLTLKAPPWLTGTNARWALGDVTGTVPARGPASLSTHMNFLGRPVSSALIDLNPEGWVVAQRLKFNHQDARGRQSSSLARYQHLQATTCPLTIKVDKTTIVGQGSMRKAFAALVKTNGHNGGPPQITNWVAKVRIHDKYPTINPHATDARMYEACGHLLCAFQVTINRCTSHVLNDAIRQKIKAFELVRHCVAFVGDSIFPVDVYFLEASLPGDYVKYSSNVNFSVPLDQPGMDLDNLAIMNVFTHWTYITSQGTSLLCDLQGVGPILTDPQILDRDAVGLFPKAHVYILKVIGHGFPSSNNNQVQNNSNPHEPHLHTTVLRLDHVDPRDNDLTLAMLFKQSRTIEAIQIENDRSNSNREQLKRFKSRTIEAIKIKNDQSDSNQERSKRFKSRTIEAIQIKND
ncbi:hypothetical protein MJO29_002506 [Puccinia striiformis f. sp. tritici]|nr:hypothetical protein MJO29_002506 [Puccinia striiformis f. sp. tritici]